MGARFQKIGKKSRFFLTFIDALFAEGKFRLTSANVPNRVAEHSIFTGQGNLGIEFHLPFTLRRSVNKEINNGTFDHCGDTGRTNYVWLGCGLSYVHTSRKRRRQGFAP
jgi:hypothetical protein